MINTIKLKLKKENTTVRDNDIMLDEDYYWFIICFLLSFAMDSLIAIMECDVIWIIL